LEDGAKATADATSDARRTVFTMVTRKVSKVAM
jgi:hypothetical protein